MRFKAKLAMEHVQLLHDLIVPISRLTGIGGGVGVGPGGGAKNSIGGGTTIYLDPDVLRISARGGTGSGGAGGGGSGGRVSGVGSGGTEGIACFAELAAANGVFLEHKIESVAKDVIVFDIDLAQLRTALAATMQSAGGGGGDGGSSGATRSAPLHNSNSNDDGRRSRSSVGSTSSSSNYASKFLVVMKLAKRGGLPCLCLDASCAGGALDIHHAVPVRILRTEEWQHHLPPIVNTPDVQLELPVDRPLRTVIERLKSISPIIYVEGSMAGELVLRIDSDAASIRTFYGKLNPRVDESSTQSRNSIGADAQDPAHCVLKVDSRKLLAALQWQSSVSRSSVSSSIICMIENEMMVVHVMLNPEDVGFFTYYVPVHFVSGDVMDY